MAFSTVPLTKKQAAQFRLLAFTTAACGQRPIGKAAAGDDLKQRMDLATNLQRWAKMSALKSELSRT